MASPFAPLFWAMSDGHRQMSTNAEIRRKWDKRGIRKHLRSRVAECIVAGITNEAIAKIAIIAEIAKIGKPSPAPLKHRGNGESGGTQNPTADWRGSETHIPLMALMTLISADLNRAFTTEARRHGEKQHNIAADGRR